MGPQRAEGVRALIVLAAAVVWLALVATRKRGPLLIASAILAAAWLSQVEFRKPVAKASMISTPSRGSCASLAPGMTAAEVKASMGEADETRSDEETRGPGASVMLYRDSRCAVHLLDDRVELIE